MRDLIERIETDKCLAPVEPNGCGRDSYRNGLCMGHRQRRQRGQRIDTPIKEVQNSKKHPAYGSWRSMRERCQNPNNKAYKYYGARGITFYAAWDTFIIFRDWAESNGYKEGLTLERINVNENYSPENCTWIPLESQARNRTNSKLLTFQGETKTEVEWSEDDRCKISYHRFRDRIRLGFSVKEALMELPERLCDWDEKPFSPVARNQRFCSRGCGTAWWNNPRQRKP